MQKSFSQEGIADAILFVLVTIPLLGYLFLGAPQFSVLTSTNALYVVIFYTDIFLSPLLLACAIFSLTAKVRRFWDGYRPNTFISISLQAIYAMPLVAVILAFSDFILIPAINILLEIIKAYT